MSVDREGCGCDGQPQEEPVATLRCDCGALLARLVPGGVELKCRRCKQTRVLPLSRESRPGAD